jgi:hypothetical protein
MALIPAAVLRFEADWMDRPYGPSKARAIRATFGVSPSRFYAELNRMLDSDALAIAYPWLVSPLRDRRRRRTAARLRPVPSIEVQGP